MGDETLREIAGRALAAGKSPLLRHRPGGRHEVREGVTFVAWGIPGSSSNKAVVLGPAPPLARVRELADAFFAGVAGGYGILVEADAGHPVEAELRADHWCVVEDEPALVMPHIPEPPPLPRDLEVASVRDAGARRDFVAVLAAGFGAPTAEAAPEVPPEAFDSLAPTLADALDPDVAILVGREAGRPVSCALYHRVGEVALVTGVATVPERRRRGFGRALTWAALAAAARRGCTCAALNSLGASYPLYRSMGFRHVVNHRTYAAT
jgi:GNAT superfamily N-acetyltransferase